MRSVICLLFVGMMVSMHSCTPEEAQPRDGITMNFEDEHLVGGWTEQSLDWDVGLADYELLKLRLREEEPDLEIGPLLRIETQVVAGFNVRLTARYRKGQQSGVIQAVVFHAIDGSRSLNQHIFFSEIP